MILPADSHVHSEWSWDAMAGSMHATCEKAVEIGLPSLAFTEHVDHTVWTVSADVFAGLSPDHPVAGLSDERGRVQPPPLDVEGYLESLERCRARFPRLRVLSGLEVGEPHWHSEAVAAVLASTQFDRVLGSLHSLPSERGFEEPVELFKHRDPGQVIRDYLLEVARLVHESDAFSTLAHIDYPLRYWPATRGGFDLGRFEAEFRYALRATAQSGRALEISTVLPLDAAVLRWWHEEGGTAVTFGSDAHEPADLARNFTEAAAMAEARGFRPTADPSTPWPRA